MSSTAWTGRGVERSKRYSGSRAFSGNSRADLRLLLGFGDDAEVGFQGLPAARIFLLGFVVLNGGNDDNVLALFPIHRRRHLVFSGKLH